MSEAPLEELVEKTKERPGYIFNFLTHALLLATAVQILSLGASTNKLTVIIVYGLVALHIVKDLAPIMGRQVEDFADTFWTVILEMKGGSQ